MKRFFCAILSLVALTCGLTLSTIPTSAKPRSKAPTKAKVTDVKLQGYIGQRIDECIEHRVKAQDVASIVDVFSRQDETQERWQTEFWGKWVQGAMSSYRYNHDAALYNIIKESVAPMLAAQLPNGYIGNYDEAHQLRGWDVWGRKYTTLGLLKWYLLSGDKAALDAACRLIDYTMTQVGPGAPTPIYQTGMYRGMASSSILEPVMLLYGVTKQEKYLDFARHIARQMNEAGGPLLIDKADTPVANRHPVEEKDWWSPLNGQKAYEMMSCYVGLLELYKVTGDEKLLATVETVVRHIMDEEINICGSAASYECWFSGKKRQTIPAYDSMETCVTFTWMQLNERLLQITGRPVYADNIERSAYNALMASMKQGGGDIVQYTPLEGFRMGNYGQCGMAIHCCNANGPRAFAMIPRVAYMTRGTDSLDVNLYIPSQVEVTMGGQKVALDVQTDYPATGLVRLVVTPTKPQHMTLSLRIPAWSQNTEVRVNGTPVTAQAGRYVTIDRTWQAGDEIVLTLDVQGRLCLMDHQQAIVRGPIVLARTTRFHDGFVDETCEIPATNGIVPLRPVTPPADTWLAFEVEAPTSTYRNEDQEVNRKLHFCDFASAGNTWDQNERYRVWLTRTLNVQKSPR